MERDGQYSWVLICDLTLIQGVQKLRWPTISAVKRKGDLLFIVQQTHPEGGAGVFVVSLEKGSCYRFRWDLTEGSVDTYMLLSDIALAIYGTTEVLDPLSPVSVLLADIMHAIEEDE